MKIILNLEKNLIDTSPGLIKAIRIAIYMMDYKPDDEKTVNKFLYKPVVEKAMEIFSIKRVEAETFNKWYMDYYGRKGKYENDFFPGAYNFLNKLTKNYEVSIITSLYEAHAIQILKKKGIFEYFEFVKGMSIDNSINTKSDIISNLLETMDNMDKDEKIVIISSDKEDIEIANKLICPSIYIGDAEEISAISSNRAKNYDDVLEILNKLNGK